MRKLIQSGYIGGHPSGMTLVASFAVFVVVAAVAFGAFFILDLYQDQPVTPDSSGTTLSLNEQLESQSELKRFASITELTDYLEVQESREENDYFGLGMIDDRAFLETTPQATVSEADGTGGAKEFSSTNVQVAGVDEGDIVKTDGTFVYTTTDTEVLIINVEDEENPVIASRITLDATPRGLFISGDTLVVYASDYSIVPLLDSSSRELSLPAPSSSFTTVFLYNIEDRTNPLKIREVSLEGDYHSSRMIDGTVYFITTAYSYLYTQEFPIPAVVDNGQTLPFSGTRCNCPELWYVDAPFETQVFTSVTAISLTDPDASLGQELFLLESAENVYMSDSHLYIAYTKYLNEFDIVYDVYKEVLFPLLADADQQKIRDIEQSPTHVLSAAEKKQKVFSLLSNFVNGEEAGFQTSLSDDVETALENKFKELAAELEKTMIHKVALDGTDMQKTASGEVVGHVLNQFSMDEHDGMLRVTTTKSQRWSGFGVFENDSYNNVYVLDESLNLVGKIENLAAGERIYSTRFIGNRAYVVTFRQVDPLFVIDLTDPTQPEVLGELKVPGFSSYLHPYGDSFLIGFGRQTDPNGRTTGVKLSLFDVSDVNNLREVDTYVFDGAWNDSLALSDHKAFLFADSKDLLVVPVTLYETSGEGEIFSTVEQNGAAVFTVTDDGFTYRDRIDHSDGSAADNTSKMFYDYSYYNTAVKRSLYIEDLLYTVSTKYLKSHAISTLDEQASLTLL